MTSQFGAQLRRLRLRAGMTQEELANRSGLGERTIRRLETGEQAEPQADTVQSLADALELPPADRADLRAVVGNQVSAQSQDIHANVLGGPEVRSGGDRSAATGDCSPDRWGTGGLPTGDTGRFGDTAQRLARNPLGIIALFIVLVYGLAALVTAFSGALSPAERIPLVYFLIAFPVLVLGVFAWLVSRHSNKLFSPRDFQNEENYVKMLSATASLAIASVKSEVAVSEGTVDEVIDAVRETRFVSSRNRVLWVDDRPENNVHERGALEAMGISFTLALSTNEALDLLEARQFVTIISDMQRKEGSNEGYLLLGRLRQAGNKIPFFVYSNSNAPDDKQEARTRGAQGSTNDPRELFGMVMRAVVNS